MVGLLWGRQYHCETVNISSMKKERCLLSIALFFIICKAISRERKCLNCVTFISNCVTFISNCVTFISNYVTFINNYVTYLPQLNYIFQPQLVTTGWHCRNRDWRSRFYHNLIKNNKPFEAIYQIHGKQPLQNGGERRVEKTWAAFHHG